MKKSLVVALMMSGCVFGAETDVVGTNDNALVRISGVQAQTEAGMQDVRDATFLPDFATGVNELSFDSDGFSGTITFEDLPMSIRNGGGESILIERSDGTSEVQPIQITSEVIDRRSSDGRFDRRATMTFVTYIDNRSVQVVVELDLGNGYDC